MFDSWKHAARFFGVLAWLAAFVTAAVMQSEIGLLLVLAPLGALMACMFVWAIYLATSDFIGPHRRKHGLDR